MVARTARRVNMRSDDTKKPPDLFPDHGGESHPQALKLIAGALEAASAAVD